MKYQISVLTVPFIRPILHTSHVHHLFKVEVHHVTSNNVNVNTHATIKLLNQLPNYWLLYWISGTGL